MKKLIRNNRGFTLVEMLIVIAIIVVLASVAYLAVSTYLNKATQAKEKISTQQESFDQAQDEINQKFVDLGY